MKKKLLFFSFIFSNLPPKLLTKNCMPRLDRLKSKVEQALISTPKESLRSILERTHKSPDVLPGTSTTQFAKLHTIQHTVSNLYWSHQQDLIYKIDAAHAQSTACLLTILREHLAKKFPTHKAPFIAFAAQAHEEEKTLLHCTTELMRLMGEKIDQQDVQGLPKKIQAELNKVIQCKQMLEKLLTTINAALMNSL